MAKNINHDQERNDQEFRDIINERIQKRAGELKEQLQDAIAKAEEEAKIIRKRKIIHEVACCLFAVAGVAGLYLAETAGLISPVLTAPIYAFAFTYLGWHLRKACRLRGRK